VSQPDSQLMEPQAQGGLSEPEFPAGDPPTAEPPMSREVLGRIDAYADMIARVAQEEQVDPAEVKGFIAAESAGKADSVSSSGYRGLMQASRDQEDIDKPEVSVRKGARKLREFRASVQRLLRPHGIDLAAMDRWTQLRFLARAYNAGPGVVDKAVGYARTAGDAARWQEAAFYQRALLHHGSYSTRPYAPKGKEGDAEEWRRKLRHRNLTLSQARAEGMPTYVERAIEKKWEHTAGYVGRIVAYARHYARAEARA
jgi:hypothetical protein